MMKKSALLLIVFLAGIISFGNAQERKCKVNLSTDLVSSFIWRGTKIGYGPAIQPTLEFTAGGFTLGTWGSIYFSDDDNLETDLFASYSFDFGLSIGVNDYYFPTTRFYKEDNHAFELQANFQKGIFSLSANYMLNKNHYAEGSDLYFEAGVKAGEVNLFAGAGNGWHTPDLKFALCNLGLSSTRNIKITDSFSLPLTGSVIFNPRMERLYMVVGITL